jgi:sulfatase modifying factor 1
MKSNHHRAAAIAIVLIVTSASLAGSRADLSGDAVVDFQTTMDMPFVTVGNVGNAGELSGTGAGGWGNDRVCGAVDYEYRIGKFEVTAGQYTEFLNAVAVTDTRGLYDTNMSSSEWGCQIQQHGVNGSYSYSVASNWADRPVADVSWADAARFCNWLTNGKPTGPIGPSTTENGSYDFVAIGNSGTIADYMSITRKSPEEGGRYYLPTEDEWYKAAYHKNDGVTGNYYDYPTGSDDAPSNILVDPDPGNSGNLRDENGVMTIDAPYRRTEVGEFENSPSPYGAFDMGGNVSEWNETAVSWESRGVRGGAFVYKADSMRASARGDHYPNYETDNVGFRVVEVPEPATMSLLGLGAIALLRRRR